MTEISSPAIDRDAAALLMEPLTDIVVQAGAAILAVSRSTMQVTDKSDGSPVTEADMAAHDPSDYEGLNKLNGQLQAVSDESGALETEWMELSEKLE